MSGVTQKSIRPPPTIRRCLCTPRWSTVESIWSTWMARRRSPQRWHAPSRVPRWVVANLLGLLFTPSGGSLITAHGPVNGKRTACLRTSWALIVHVVGTVKGSGRDLNNNNVDRLHTVLWVLIPHLMIVSQVVIISAETVYYAYSAGGHRMPGAATERLSPLRTASHMARVKCTL